MSTESEIIKSCKVVAVVGCSSNPSRPSHTVSSYLKSHGFKVIPVNPAEKEILGEVCYPDIASIPEEVDVVDIFRKSEDVPPIVEQAIKKGAKAVWMQYGVVNEPAAKRAREAGLKVVMDKCLKVEHSRTQTK